MFCFVIRQDSQLAPVGIGVTQQKEGLMLQEQAGDWACVLEQVRVV